VKKLIAFQICLILASTLSAHGHMGSYEVNTTNKTKSGDRSINLLRDYFMELGDYIGKISFKREII